MMRDIERRHELSVGQQIVDPRTFGDKATEWLSVWSNLLTLSVPLLLGTVLAPVLGFVLIPVLLVCTLAHVINRPLLPLRYPHDRKNDKGKPGDGILYMGSIDSPSPYEKFKEIWLSDNDLRMHMLILGATGSGKSEALKTIFFNALNWSSGFFIADGKADNKLPTDTFIMVRSRGRDPDMLVLNFLLGGKTPEQVRTSRRRRTNKLNPFPSADADTIIQMGANLLPKVEGDAKNWQEKALNLWRSVVTACAYKRDTTGFELSVTTFIDYMSLAKVEELYMEGWNEAQHRNGEWSYGFAGIKNYLDSGCPAYQVAKLLKKHGHTEETDDNGSVRTGGFNKRGGKETEQDTMAYEQHSYRTNQLMPVLNLLDKTYGFIFRDKYPEIDMTDVTLRNRILVMLIPSLEKSAAEAENLGKLAIACLRVMMSKNLGSEVEGTYEELLGSKATNSPYPYVIALDELAYYFSDGIAVMFAQARSLGCCMIAAAQDLEKLTEGNKSAEAGAMLANQVTKLFMRIDDTGKTAEMVQKVVGKATVAVKRGFRYNSLGYQRRPDIEVMEMDRVSPQRLKQFNQGQGIVDALGRTYFMNWFYMGKDNDAHRVPKFHVNRFLQVAPPSPDDIVANSIPIDEFNDPYRKGQDLLKMLKQQVSVDLQTRHDPVLDAIGKAAVGFKPFLEAQDRSVALYWAARTAVLAENAVKAAADSGTERTVHKQAPTQNGVEGFAGASVVESQEAIDAAAPAFLGDVKDAAAAAAVQAAPMDDDDPLAFLRDGTPFERKSAEEVLGYDTPLTDDDVAHARDLESDAATTPSVFAMNPFDAMIEHGKTIKLSNSALLRGNGIISKLVSAPDVSDPDTGLSLVPKDDWIATALRESESMLSMPRASDNTVVGLTQTTMGRVQEVERLLDSPDPVEASKALQKVVSARVTLSTDATEEIIQDDIDEYFNDLTR